MMEFDAPLVAVRWVHFAVTMLLFGTALWALYAPPPARSVVPHGASLALAVIALASAGAWALLTLIHISGEGIADPALIRTMLLGTGFGRAFVAEALIALVLIITLTALPRLRWAHAAVSGALLAALAFVGHSAVGQGLSGDARLAGQAMHLLSGGAWLGALPALYLSLAAAPQAAGESVRRFSTMGIVAVLAILVTGAANTALMLGMSRAFVSSIYFRVLLVKLALVAAMIAVAVINRVSISPQIGRSPTAALRSLRRNVIFEQGLGLGVLAVVSWLGALDPSM